MAQVVKIRNLSSTDNTKGADSLEAFIYVTGPLWGESTGHRWIPFAKDSQSELWCFFLSAP